MGLMDLLRQIAVPRPGGSSALDKAGTQIADYCRRAGLHVTEETFMLRAYMQGVVALTLVVLAALTLFFVIRRKYWIALALAVLIPAVYLLEFEANVTTVSALSPSTGRNIVAEIGPESPTRELIISSHYDSKTELFDHQQRAPIYNAAVVAMLLLLAATLWGVLAGPSAPAALRRTWAIVCLAGLLGLVALAVAFGGGLLLKEQSPGTRDNGTSVVVMLGLADELGKNPEWLKQTRVKLVFFSGEETNMQGSAAFVKRHEFSPGHTAVLNLECLAGEGPLRYHEASGTFLGRSPSDPTMIRRVCDAAGQLGLEVVPDGLIYDDSARFLQAGIPAVTISHSVPGVDDSFHSTADSIDKVVPGKMEESVRFIQLFIERYDIGF